MTMVVFRDNLVHTVVNGRFLFKFQSAVRLFFNHYGDHHDHGRFEVKFDPRGRQMVVLVAEPPAPLHRVDNSLFVSYFIATCGLGFRNPENQPK